MRDLLERVKGYIEYINSRGQPQVNYIKSLQEENAQLKAEKEAMESQLADLLRYINSSKFHCGDDLDGYVSISDVQSRVMNALSGM